MAGIKLKGDTSGEIVIESPDVAGTNTLTLPASTGTVALTKDDVYVKMTRTSTQAYSNGITADVVYNGIEEDSHSLVSGSTFVVTAATAGLWYISASSRASGDPIRGIITLLVNGTEIAKFDTEGRSASCNTIVDLVNGDTVKATYFQNSGGNLNTVADAYSNQLTAYRIA